MTRCASERTTWGQPTHYDGTTVYFVFQECDQVHVEDVASDDNGQDLRCVRQQCSGYLPRLTHTHTHTHFDMVTLKLYSPRVKDSQPCFSLLVPTTSWRTASAAPAAGGPRPGSRAAWSGCGNWPSATAG